MLMCHQRRLKPFKWLAVPRQFNPLLRRVYGAGCHKSYGNFDRKRRTYRIPTPGEVERAIAEPDVVELAERRRASGFRPWTHS
jgi:hypothetical protein